MDSNLFGLPNLGNTCFINASIQCLLTCTEMVNEIQKRDVSGDLNKRVLRVIFSMNGLPLQRHDICSLLMHTYARDNTSYTMGESQDCSEYLTYFIDNLGTQSQKITIETEIYDTVKLTTLKAVNTENILFLPIVNSNGIKLNNFNDCLSEYLCTSDGDNNINYRIKSTGKQIFIGLKRFIGILRNGQYFSHKLNNNVTMPHDIVIPVDGTDVEYRMIAMIVHFGQLNGGHYICFRKINNEWVFIDDENIGTCGDIRFDQGYIYVYESIE